MLLKAGPHMNVGSRLVILWVILGVCVVNASVAIFTGKQPPEALYGVLGTIGAYVLLRDKQDLGGDEEDDDPPPRRRRRVTAAAPEEEE